MSEYRALLSGWPDWARLLYVCAMVPVLALALVFDYILAVWCVLGPLIIWQVWMNRDTAKYGRSPRPWLFWGSLIAFGAMTVRGVVELYQKLIEASL